MIYGEFFGVLERVSVSDSIFYYKQCWIRILNFAPIWIQFQNRIWAILTVIKQMLKEKLLKYRKLRNYNLIFEKILLLKRHWNNGT